MPSMTAPASFLRTSSPHRRLLGSRRSSSQSSGSPSAAHSFPRVAPVSLPDSTLFAPMIGETDAQCWKRMLALQKEYHCYNSARLEAAVEAEERGEENVLIPSRLCLILLNESLRSWVDAHREGLLCETFEPGAQCTNPVQARLAIN
ncbi:hypothetical protein BJ875DRAFT_436228 [Amylocarpus encephaloides]|uniref:Uncharacterized protein n=1 Tax=Amylocarpus encephaloides TaxID=45428 RepID=A0A9P7YTT9_9HELO|nr:hypothetical protein BJ875DRAFT_436228 [Amylocarpus encephaloides]